MASDAQALLTHMRRAYAPGICVQTMPRTNVRTDEQTDASRNHRNQASTPYRTRAWADLDDPENVSPVGGLIDEVIHKLLAPRERWPLLCTGSRANISPILRRLVYERDGYACRNCGSSLDWLQLDHIIPWSAWGPDTSDNLRTLCEPCNLQRSNYRDPFERPQLPVARWCFWCVVEAEDDDEAPDDVPDPEDRIRVFCGYCGIASWVPNADWIL